MKIKNMKLNKEILYWSRGCLTGTDSSGEMSCRSVKDCHKLTVYDWLKDIPTDKNYDVFEVRFKNTRKGFYRNINNIELEEGDIVAVEASPGHDIGIISASGPVAELKLRKTGQLPDSIELKKIYRTAKPADIEKWQEAVSLEYPTMIQSRKFAAMLGLNMKIGNVEYQGDRTKAIFYYIADERVDFRELIKVMADSFKIRIEMRQIGARQEAGLIGGIGPCGRELCCAQWMTNFVSVSTTSARSQDLSVNPLKLAGQCGKLKCCLNYEIDTYLDALKNFPSVKEIHTSDGPMYLQKIDALKSVMWFSKEPGSFTGVLPLPVDKVQYITEMNKKGIKPDMSDKDMKIVNKEFMGAEVEDSITRFDKKQGKTRHNQKSVGKKDFENKSSGIENENRPKDKQNSDNAQKNKPDDHVGKGRQKPKNNNQQQKYKSTDRKKPTGTDNLAPQENKKQNDRPKRKYNHNSDKNQKKTGNNE